MIYDARCDTEREVERRELMDFVFRAVDSLPVEQRAVLIATEFEGWSFRELSEEWEIPIGTLLARKSRALQHIRKKLTGLV
jgi:RNA polymerase sigma factor (sigma-70 family)